MSVKQCCRLCCTTCIKYEQLQKEAGNSNEIYEITVKYFDPMLLTEEENSNNDLKLNVLCNDCWLHISDFHEFQRSVLLVRNSLEKCNTISQMETVVKQEFNEENTAADDIIEDNNSFDFDCEKNDYDCFPDDNSLNNDDDRNPLVTLRKRKDKKQLKYLSIQIKDDDHQSDDVLEHYSRNEEALFENDYLEIENFKIESPKSFDDISIKISNDEKLEHQQTESCDSALEEVNSKHKKLTITDGTKEGNLCQNVEKSKELDAFIAEWKAELNCDLCSETAKNFDELRSHFKENHNTRFYIKCCERKFFRRSVLVNHIKLHLNPETHKCDICGKSISTNYNLKLHKKVMHEDTKQFQCDICEKLFRKKFTLERHLLTHTTGKKDFICSECGKGFVVEQLLKLHIRHVHDVDRVCNQCGKTIHGYRALKKHLMQHAGIESRKYPCDECGLELKYSNGLKLHKAAYHNDGTTIYICGVCGKVSASENALRSHKKLVHDSERKHKCTYCEKAFKRPKSLREHIATHTGQDLYQCPHCPKTFKFSDRLYQHRKKFHPVEWEERHKNRLQYPKIDTSKEKKQIVIC